MTTKTFVLTAILALAAALAATASPARALGGPDTCPVGFALVNAPDSESRLADRDRDGRACAKTTALAGRMLAFAGRRGPTAFRPNPRDCASCLLVLTDNVSAIHLPALCEAPFAADDARGYTALDRNSDGVLCSAISGRALVLLDNARAA